jgi:cytochrome oxidase Cu insertion factor (SCO1/SenC/PrrC family)
MRSVSSVLLLVLLVGSSLGQFKPYPQPQIPSATGQPAPDFSLKDANGNLFTLSQQRGSWVLLYFYRGYW